MPSAPLLGPTYDALADPSSRPYFLWWTDATVADFLGHLADPDPEVRAYWLGALLREANSRDVWAFASPDELRTMWPRLVRHLGRSRPMWSWLLEVHDVAWPPAEARGG